MRRPNGSFVAPVIAHTHTHTQDSGMLCFVRWGSSYVLCNAICVCCAASALVFVQWSCALWSAWLCVCRNTPASSRFVGRSGGLRAPAKHRQGMKPSNEAKPFERLSNAPAGTNSTSRSPYALSRARWFQLSLTDLLTLCHVPPRRVFKGHKVVDLLRACVRRPSGLSWA